MSLSTRSALETPYSSGGAGASRTSEGRSAREQMADVRAHEAQASSTVTLSDKALDVLGSIGSGVADVVEWPYEIAKDVVGGVVSGAEAVASEGWDLLSSGVKAVASGVGTVAHAVVIDAPCAVASEVHDLAKSALDDATSVASQVVSVAAMGGSAGGLSLIKSLI